MENKRVVFLDYLRVFAIIMVLVVHCCEQYYFNANGELHFASAGDAFWVTVFDSAVRSCVPLFVMASAYLLFPVTKPTARARAMHRSVGPIERSIKKWDKGALSLPDLRFLNRPLNL